jgi:hypothetical protein
MVIKAPYCSDMGLTFLQEDVMSDGYNGWSNYETWAVNAHIGHCLDSIARDECNNTYLEDTAGVDAYDLADQFKDWYEEHIKAHAKLPDLISDLVRDDKINWRELAETILSDIIVDKENE